MPGDARFALTVGSPPGLTGAGAGVELLTKPDALVSDSANNGTALSAGFVGGAAGSLISSGAVPGNLLRSIGLPAGSKFVIPDEWLKTRTYRRTAR
jgi:hypothetical protein